MKMKARLSSVVSLRRPSRVESTASSAADLAVQPSPKENSLSGLPEEVLLEVLLFLQQLSDQASFASYLLCCRRWHRICQPLLYGDVLLLSGSRHPESGDEYARKDRARLGARVASFTTGARGGREQLVRSLTLRTASCNIDWPKWRPLRMLDRRRSERNHWFPALCRTLPQLRCLSTFSLKVGDNGARVFWTPQGRLADILDALPQSVVHLELDSMGADFATAGPSASPSHVCASLGRLLPRLRSLRLRLRFLCEDVFGALEGALAADTHTDVDAAGAAPTSSKLQRAVVVFTPRLGTIGSQSSLLQTRLCGTFERPQHGEVFDRISRRCRALCAVGAFPDLQHFRLVDRASNDADGRGYEVYDAAADERENVTWSAAAASGLLGDRAAASVEEMLLVPEAYWYAANEHNVRFASLAEGHGGWHDTGWQCRQPMSDSTRS